MSQPSIAIAHEWVAASAGSEKVFAQLACALPQADLYTLSVSPHVELKALGERAVETSFLDRGILRDKRAFTLPLMPLAWRSLRSRRRYDVIITSSHAFARFFAKGSDALHLSYVHAPMRYAWNHEIDQRGEALGLVSPVARHALRWIDKSTVPLTTSWAANSTEVQSRLASFYGVDARVIHPPVEVSRFTPTTKKSDSLVAFSRFISYKRLDLAIRTAEAVGMPIKILGRGPEVAALRKMAVESAVPVEIVEGPSDRRVEDELARAAALIFPAREDFGIVPVEAQAAGTPVVAVRGFGADDTVIDGATGALVEDQSVEALAGGVRRVMSDSINARSCVANAQRFTEAAFRRSALAWVEEALEGAGIRLVERNNGRAA